MPHHVLGRQVPAPDRYAPEVLVAVPRALGRAALKLRPDDPPVHLGVDVWNAYELAWRGPDGRPQLAIATLTVPADSPNLVESKSLKLYLGGLYATSFAEPNALCRRIADDVGAIVGCPIEVELASPAAWCGAPVLLEGACVDASPYAAAPAGAPSPYAQALRAVPTAPASRPQQAKANATTEAPGEQQVLTSQLLRTLCPVTGQPDWADVQIRVRGARLQPEGLLSYIASFCQHTGFHEQCVEQILLDVYRACRAQAVAVLARYTRRGGIDINPWRTTDPSWRAPANVRTPRQ